MKAELERLKKINNDDGMMEPGLRSRLTCEEASWLIQQFTDLTAERDKYELELSKTTAILQTAIEIGKVKHIGLLEAAAGVKELTAERDDIGIMLDNFGIDRIVATTESDQNGEAIEAELPLMSRLELLAESRNNAITERDRLAGELAELNERIEESTIITVKINDNRAVYPTLYPEDFNLKEGQWKNFRLFPLAGKEGAE